MRDFFPIALTELNTKGEEVGTLFLFLNHIVGIRKFEKHSEILALNSKYLVRESFEDITKKCAIYGLMKVV